MKQLSEYIMQSLNVITTCPDKTPKHSAFSIYSLPFAFCLLPHCSMCCFLAESPLCLRTGVWWPEQGGHRTGCGGGSSVGDSSQCGYIWNFAGCI